jgi:ADP-heptose:LPS heptosyltransferase
MSSGGAKAVLRPLIPALKKISCAAIRFVVDSARSFHLLSAVPRSPSGSQRFLIITPTTFMGDTVMLLPMVELLRRAHPDAIVEVAIGKGAAPLLQMVQEIDRVYPLPLRTSLPASLKQIGERLLDLTAAYLNDVKQANPDIVLLTRWGDDLFRGHYLGYLTGAKRRIGFDSRIVPGSQSSARDTMLTEAYPGGSGLHESQRLCLLLSQARLVPEPDLQAILNQPVASLEKVAAMTDWGALSARLGIDAKAVFAVIAPGASQPNRRWPAGRWVEVIAHLRRKGLETVLLSGPKDADVALEIHQLASESSVLVAGTTTLQESVTLLSRARLFLGNDSGPGHAAGALGTPTVTLFIDDGTGDPHGASSPIRIHPLGPYVAACLPPQCLPPCSGCCSATSAHCIEEINVEQVISAAETLLVRSDDRTN